MRATAVGHCIYCGLTTDLSEEHVIPLGLGGDFILPDASCATCAKITSKIEVSVLRDHLIGPRISIGFPSRQAKKSRRVPPAPRVWGVTKAGVKEPITFPGTNQPTLLWLPQYEAPGCVQNKRITGINVNGVEVRQLSGPDIRQYARKQGYVSVEYSCRVMGYDFARMLAKIALGFSTDYFGVDYNTSCLGGVVLNNRNDAGQWIGQPTIALPGIAKTYQINHGLHIVKLYGNNKHCQVLIRLFAKHNTTMEYLVIVA